MTDVRLIKLLEVCASELIINNQLKLVEDTKDGVFNGYSEFISSMTTKIQQDLKTVKSVMEESDDV